MEYTDTIILPDNSCQEIDPDEPDIYLHLRIPDNYVIDKVTIHFKNYDKPNQTNP